LVDLNLYLEEGFFKDTVLIFVNGEKVYHKEGLTTHAVIGLADSMTTNISNGRVEIEVICKNRNMSKKIAIDLKTAIHLAISVKDKGIHYRISKEPFSYM